MNDPDRLFRKAVTGVTPLRNQDSKDIPNTPRSNRIPPEIDPEKVHHILGGQGNVWTEYIKTESHLEYMAMPRMSAMAEVLWSSKSDRSYKGFIARLGMSHFRRFDRMDVNYRRLDDNDRSWNQMNDL